MYLFTYEPMYVHTMWVLNFYSIENSIHLIGTCHKILKKFPTYVQDKTGTLLQLTLWFFPLS